MKFSQIPYERADIQAAALEIRKLAGKMKTAASGEEQLAIHDEFYGIWDRLMTTVVTAHIRHDIDVSDPFYEKEQNYYDEQLPKLHKEVVDYQDSLLASPFRDVLEKRIGKVAFTNMELQKRSVDDRILPLMQEENALQTRYAKLLATARIPWEGEELNLSLMTPYLRSSSREVRKQAWEKFTAFFSDNREELDEIYDCLVRNRTKQAEKLGYGNYLTLGYYRMRRNCYGRSEVEAFRRQVREDLVPAAQKIHEKRRVRLGIDRLRYFDEGVAFVNGNPAPTGTPDEILAAGRRMYGELSPETKKFMDFICENELFDVLGRKTKRTGGYMTYLPLYRSPFIFANFNGTSGDVDVITHECGHAFQGFISADDPVREHADITMETAETHSMSMEFFTEPWMDLFFGKRAEDYHVMHLEDSVIFVPYGTMVDEFQDIVYSNPSLTPKQRNGVWRDLERQYKPHLDYTGNEYFGQGAYWQRQHHIFDHPLYYIDYCIASVNALQYKVWMDRDFKGAWDSYLKLCRLSASDYFTGLVGRVGLKNPFDEGCIASVVRDLGI